MNLKECHWTKKEYDNFIKELKLYIDQDYLKFQKKIILDGKPILGIRTPILKKIAKEISRGEYELFLKQNSFQYYEEIILYGFVLSNLKLSLSEMIPYLNIFACYIDNWAICDLVAGSLKIFGEEKELGYEFILSYLESKEEWKVRFGLVLLLNYYIEEERINTVLNLSEQIANQEYYVKMANAWLISICYIKYPKQTTSFLEKTRIDDWTYNKAISKICDSYRVTKEEKNNLKRMKR